MQKLYTLFCLTLLSLSLPLYAQDLSPIYDNLDQLQSLIENTLNNSEQQSKHLTDLNKTLDENMQMLNERGHGWQCDLCCGG
jgi:hypothetical protein